MSQILTFIRISRNPVLILFAAQNPDMSGQILTSGTPNLKVKTSFKHRKFGISAAHKHYDFNDLVEPRIQC